MKLLTRRGVLVEEVEGWLAHCGPALTIGGESLVITGSQTLPQEVLAVDKFLANLGAAAFRDVPEFGAYDVVVLGGGPAGIAAATTAAEMGHKTLLIERLGYCGGAAVSGMSGTICGLFLTVDDPKTSQPEQIIFGFAERFRSALVANGGLTGPQIYGKSWVTTHDCAKYKRTATDLLRGAGVHVLLHTQMIDVLAQDDALSGLILHTKSGYTKVVAKRVVDASGDADAVFKMGARTLKGNNGVIQNPTMMFKIGNVDIPRYLDYWGQTRSLRPRWFRCLRRVMNWYARRSGCSPR